jgi:hypothetical protein
MILAELRMLDRWMMEGAPLKVTRATIEQLRKCCRLVGVADAICDDVSEQNFLEKVETVCRAKKLASDAFGLALLQSRGYEDFSDIPAAITVFERFLINSTAQGYNELAKREIARLSRLRP